MRYTLLTIVLFLSTSSLSYFVVGEQTHNNTCGMPLDIKKSRADCLLKCLEQNMTSVDYNSHCRSLCLLKAYIDNNQTSLAVPVVIHSCSEDLQKVLSTFPEVNDLRVHKDCLSLYQSGNLDDGLYLINPDEQHPVVVYCDMTDRQGGWTVIQRRVDDSVNFYRGWEDYKKGFGDAQGNFWIGLGILHLLTLEDTVVYIFLKANDSDNAYAAYEHFSVGTEGENYRLNIAGYRGTAGDSMSIHDGMKFTTKDRDNDLHPNNCAFLNKGAWWYNACHAAYLNGLYLNGPYDGQVTGVNWKKYKGSKYSLIYVEMRVRRSI